MKYKNFCLLVITVVSLIFLNFGFRAFAQEKNSQEEKSSALELPQTLPSIQDSAQDKDSQEQAALQQEDQKKSSTQENLSGPKLIKAIEIKGNKAISTNTIISKMKTKIASPYQKNVVDDDLKRLYLLGFFDDVKIDSVDFDNGIKIIVTVVERPIIEKIAFSGIRYLMMSEDKIKQSLKSKVGQYLDYPNISSDSETIRKMYEKIGYSRAQVDCKTDLNKATGKVSLNFNIIEGTRIRIKGIYAQGNKTFSQQRILRLIKTKSSWFFNPGVLKEEVLKEDVERIKVFYQKRGFADVAVSYEIKNDPKKPYLYIMFSIQEGRKYLVGTVSILGNKDIPLKDILAKIKEAAPDKVFSQEALKQDVSNIQSLYFDRGYISAQVQEATSVDPANHRVNIAYTVTENDITYVNKIKVRGNIKTKDIVIRRELRIKPGDRFDGDKLRRSKERLQNLGFFEDISYSTEDTDSSNKKDLTVDVKETKTGSFSFGGGYSTVDQLVGFFEIEQKNFDWRNFPYFTGGGQNLKFRASIGNINNAFDLSFTEPWLFDYPLSFGFDGYKRKNQKDTDVGYGYNQDVTGGDVRFGKEITEFVSASATYRYESINITDINDGASTDLTDEAGRNNISSIELGLSFDNRDNVFDPLRGNLLTGSATIAGGPLSGDRDFWKFYGRASHYFPLPFFSVLELRGRVGIANHYDDTAKIPIYERFFAGGADTVRGYRERKVGPVDPNTSDPLGGNALLIGNIEYTYPLFDFLKVAGFYDIGNVWDKASKLGQGGYKSSVGLGIRIKTPVGPVRLDYGIPFNKEPGSDTKSSGRFHFSMSNSF